MGASDDGDLAPPLTLEIGDFICIVVCMLHCIICILHS